jgi:hypothetical protein
MERGNSVIDKIKTQFPATYSVTALPSGTPDRIRIEKPGGRPATQADHINHVEVDVPPGCYIVWAHICWLHNEDMHRVMVIVRCGDEACVNLLLPTRQQCGHGFIFPFLLQAVELNLPKANVVAAAKAIMDVAEIKPKEFNEELAQRVKEVRGMKDEKLAANVMKIQEMLK